MAVASTAILFYDYFLTLGSEIERFWKGRFYDGLNWSSFLFFANRYLVLLGCIPVALDWFNEIDMDQTGCRYIFIAYNSALVIVVQIMVACMMMMRIYALYERRVGVLVFPSFLAICSVAVGVVGTVKSSSQGTPQFCYASMTGLLGEKVYYFAGAYGGEFLFDAAIFVMTFYKTMATPNGTGFNLLIVIMRDGTMYFGIMAIFNLTNILVLLLANPAHRGAMNYPMNVMSSILMTRLMLNIRDPRLNAGVEEFKTTTLNISGFNRQTESGAAGDPMNIDNHV